MDVTKAKTLLQGIVAEVTYSNGQAATDKFSGLRDVDAKVREAKMVLRAIPGVPQTLAEEMDRDVDFSANSRRVRLEALANYCRSTIKFLDSGVVAQKKQIFSAPDLSKLTAILPNLEQAIQKRWLEAQKCQHTGSYISAVIMMGSILEALLLARCSMSPALSYQAKRAPKDKNGNDIPIHDWNLSTLIDVAVEVGWIKTDRGKFSHALRESRNVVHPWNEVSTKSKF